MKSSSKRRFKVETASTASLSKLNENPDYLHMNPLMNTRIITLRSFIEANFTQRKCNVYVPQDGGMCECGRDATWHEKHNLPPQENMEWSVQECTELSPCKSYGKIRMLGFSRTHKTQKPLYIRLDSLMSNMDDLWTLLKHYWEIDEAQLILSITGSTKQFEALDERLNDSVMQGLTKVSSSINTWLLTGGTNLGVDNLVAQTAQDLPLLSHRNNHAKLNVIGIIPWGVIQKKGALNNVPPRPDGGLSVQNYFIDRSEDDGGYVALNLFHTHYLFVDDGRKKNYNGELEFRKAFETFISTKLKETRSKTCTTVQLVIGGGARAAKMILSALQSSTPIVIVKGSGKLADTLCKLHERIQEDGNIIEDAESTVKAELEENEFVQKLPEKNISELFELFVSKFKQIYIYDHDSSKSELDKVILTAVLKSQENFSHQDRLDLMMQLDRCDLAKEWNLTDGAGNRLKINELHLFMEKGLRNNQTDFVKLFLDQGVVIIKFLTADVLYSLYEEILADYPVNNTALEIFLKTHLKIISDDNSDEKFGGLSRVYQLLHRWTGLISPLMNEESRDQTDQNTSPTDERYELDPSTFTRENVTYVIAKNGRARLAHPDETIEASEKTMVYPCFPIRNRNNERVFTEQDLFLWSILFNRMSMAKIFWRLGKDQIAAALVAAELLETMSKKALIDTEVSLASSLQKNAEEWRNMALNVLDVAYNHDKRQSHSLLIRCLPQWNDNNTLGMAFQYQHVAFLHHAACQSLVQQVWMGIIPLPTPTWMTLLAIPFYPLLHGFIFPGSNKVITRCLNGSNPEIHKKSKPCAKNHVDQVEAGAIYRNTRYISEDHQQKRHHMSFWKKSRHFYGSPVVKFSLHVLSYIITLLLLTYFILVELKPMEEASDITVVEWYIWLWCLTFIIEEARQIAEDEQKGFNKLMNWLDYKWNWLDLAIILISILCVPLRLALTRDYFHHARNTYAILCCLLYIRIMQFYFVSRIVGPNVIIAFKMLKDVLRFLAIFAIMVISFGALSHALVFHNNELSMDLVTEVLHVTYWQTFGVFNATYIFGDANCTEGDTSCPHKSYFVAVALGFFMLLTHVLLLNLLIAMFGFTFYSVQRDSEKVWAFNRYGLVHEYERRPPWPFPFSLLGLIIRLFIVVGEKIGNRKKSTLLTSNTPLRHKLTFDRNQEASTFEQNSFEFYWRYERKEYSLGKDASNESDRFHADSSILNRLNLINHKLELLSQDVRQHFNANSVKPETLRIFKAKRAFQRPLFGKKLTLSVSTYD